MPSGIPYKSTNFNDLTQEVYIPHLSNIEMQVLMIDMWFSSM